MSETKQNTETLSIKSEIAKCVNINEDDIVSVEPYFDDVAQRDYLKVTTDKQIFIIWIGAKLMRASKKVNA